ncbi:hypothetical protein [Xanthovirga aplysinae]|uniref:hypothetical protein n=1 Tax=Xanthovirga aplysinae TaxID=2529853 RepID=UPI0012BC110F|nr:hypothetical protein [Xanthovirga aplysinae]MTI29393.1 hypothetical protein [Xanthovirga aplysinae]
MVSCTSNVQTNTDLFDIPKDGCIKPPVCGINVSRVQELNGLEQDEVGFHAPNTLSTGWEITDIFFDLTYENGGVGSFNGYINNFGHTQINSCGLHQSSSKC